MIIKNPLYWTAELKRQEKALAYFEAQCNLLELKDDMIYAVEMLSAAHAKTVKNIAKTRAILATLEVVA
jgi:hypothetical protein